MIGSGVVGGRPNCAWGRCCTPYNTRSSGRRRYAPIRPNPHIIIHTECSEMTQTVRISGGDKHGNHTIQLMLGDQIQITAPTNPAIHDHIFFISYIDATRIRTFDVEDRNDKNEWVVEIGEGGELSDAAIQEISLVERSDDVGYAAQNGLEVGVWMDIYFSGEVPHVLTGEIITKEDDMIEVRTYPTDELVYIDFAYQGIPEDLPIERIEVRDAIARRDDVRRDDVPESSTEQNITETTVPDIADTDPIDKSADRTDHTDRVTHDTSTPTPSNHNDGWSAAQRPQHPHPHAPEFIAADNIVFGANLGSLVNEVTVEAAYRKYGLDAQLDDMLNDAMATSSSTEDKREISRNMSRYTQLRSQFSKMSPDGDITGSLYRGARHRPLVQHILAMDAPNQWVVPVVSQTKRVYDVSAVDDVDTGIIVSTTDRDIENTNDTMGAIDGETYDATDRSTRYLRYMSELTTISRPFDSRWQGEATHNSFRAGEVGVDMDVLVGTTNGVAGPTVVHAKGSKDAPGDIVISGYVGERYTGGITKSDSFKPRKVGGDSFGQIGDATYHQYVPGDNICVQSLMVMPPTFAVAPTNILDKLTTVPSRWTSLHEGVRIKTVGVQMDGDRVKDGNDTISRPFPTHYVPKYKSSSKNPLRGKNEFRTFLEMVVPTTQSIVRQMGTAGTSTPIGSQYTMSVRDTLLRLAHHRITHDDITFQTHMEISKMVTEDVKRFKRDNVVKYREYGELHKVGKHGTGRDVLSNVMRTMNHAQDLQRSVYAAYGFDVSDGVDGVDGVDRGLNISIMSGPEVIAHMNRVDKMRLFYAALRSAHTTLATGMPADDVAALKTRLEEIAQAEADVGLGTKSKKKKGPKSSAPARCNDKVIAKHYASIGDMERDDGAMAYHDPKYDPTRYDIGKQYLQKLHDLGAIEFRGFLTEKISKHVGLTSAVAEIEADAVILGKRLVRDGSYAVTNGPADANGKITYLYFVRDEGRWVPYEDPDVDTPTFLFDNSSGLCGMNMNCAIGPGNGEAATCDSFENIKAKTDMAKIQDILDTYDADFNARVETIEATYKQSVADAFNYVAQRVRFLKREQFKRNSWYSELSVMSDPTVVAVDGVPAPTTTTTHILPDPQKVALLDKIMSQADMTNRSHDIVRFTKTQGTRTSVASESEYWYYCDDTGGKLVPTFMVRLAETLVSGGDYAVELGRICAEQGTISDDGDAWIDKHSGKIICPISFNSDADYAADGGARGVMVDLVDIHMMGMMGNQANAGNIAATAAQTSDTTRMTTRVMRAMTSFLGIDMGPHTDYVVRCVELILQKYMPDEATYDAQVKKKAEKKAAKAPPSYQRARDKFLALLTLGHLFVSIQTSVPAVKARKTFPGCDKSLTGFPQGGIEDMTGITYLTCIAAKIRTSDRPWNALPKKTLVQELVAMCRQFIINTAEYESLAGTRATHDAMLATMESTACTANTATTTTTTNHSPSTMEILPNQDRHDIVLTPVSQSFVSNIKRNLKSGGTKSNTDFYVLKEKAAVYANGIQRLIQQTVHTETLALKTSLEIPFVENACCDKRVSSKRAIEYFIKKHPSIAAYDTVVGEMDALVHDITMLRKAPYLLDMRNTKNRFLKTKPATSYSDSVKMRALITYCISRSISAYCPPDMVEKYKKVSSVGDDIVKAAMGDTSGDGAGPKTFASLVRRIQDKNMRVVGGADDTDDAADGTIARAILYGGLEPYATDAAQRRDNDPYGILDGAVVDAMIDVVKMGKRVVDVVDADAPTNTRTAQSQQTRKCLDAMVRANDAIREEIKRTMVDHSQGLASTKRNLRAFSAFLAQIRQFSDAVTPEKRAAEESGRPELDRLVSFTKMFVQHMGRTFPTSVRERVVRDAAEDMKLPVHWEKSWGMSQNHSGDVKRILAQYHDSFAGLYGDKGTDTACGEIIAQYETLVAILAVVEENSWFESDIVRGLCEHTVLTCIRIYVKVASNPQFEVRVPVRGVERATDTITTDTITTDTITTAVTGLGVSGRDERDTMSHAMAQVMDGLDGLDNEDMEVDGYDVGPTGHTTTNPDTLRRKILEMMVVFMGPMIREYDVCVIQYEDFASKMRVTREKEKDGITAYMGALGEETRQMDNTMKELRLGRWNVGMQKGLTRYVGATYDAETRGGLGASGVSGLGDLLDDGGGGGVDADADADGDDWETNEAMDMSDIPDDDGGDYE